MKAGHAIARAAKAVAKAAYKYSGAADVVSCITHPALASCVKAAVTVALVAAAGGEGEIEVAAADAAEGAGADAAEHAAGRAAEDAGSKAEDAARLCTRGGSSFSAGTLVLLANGAAVPISSLHVGEMVLATNTKTGKTQPEAITAVLVHHDTDLYDLAIKADNRAAVIQTTSSHLFWIPASHANTGRWAEAGSLRYGTHMRTPAGGYATVTGGTTPRRHTGWMWTSPSPATTTTTSTSTHAQLRSSSTTALLRRMGA